MYVIKKRYQQLTGLVLAVLVLAGCVANKQAAGGVTLKERF